MASAQQAPATVYFHKDATILKMTPINDHAQAAFHDIVEAIENQQISQHHQQHVVVTGEVDSRAETGYQSSSTDSSERVKPPVTSSKIKTGYYQINFSQVPTSSAPIWAIGKGAASAADMSSSDSSNDQLDIIIAIKRTPEARWLSSLHAYLRTHPQSGAWMLGSVKQCPTASSNCNHRVMSMGGKSVGHAQELCLSRAGTQVQIANLHFWVEFCITRVDQEVQYIRARNTFLKNLGVIVPPTPISGIPFEADKYNEFAVFRDPFANGRFGAIYLGFHPLTGSPRAIKTWRFMAGEDDSKVQTEINYHLFFTQNGLTEGIIETYGYVDSHGESYARADAIKDIHFTDYFMVMEQGRAFDISFDYKAPATSGEWQMRKTFMRQLLIGLQTIHSYGYIHGDITIQNLILIPAYPALPARAKIADFGKMQHAETSRETHLAAKIYCAPEVHGGRPYNNAIDVWGLGLALTLCWFVGPIKTMDQAIYQRIRAVLNAAPQADFADLLLRMLTYNPDQRPTAAECLNHSCFAGAGSESMNQRGVNVSEHSKRPRS